MTGPDSTPTRPRVALLVTCLVDTMRPGIGFAAVRLLQAAGCVVEVPTPQTCCGQPAYNNGDAADARALARRMIEIFDGYDYVVAPSGSCAGMLKEHYPKLFAADALWSERARGLAGRTYELMSFLVDVRGLKRVPEVRFEAHATYHDSCAGLRELGVREQPRRLLASVAGLEITEMKDREVCCGFGGTFCVKYPEISERLVSDKVADAAGTGADTVLGGDLGCLLNIAGRAQREGRELRVYHAAEVLAGMADEVAPIGNLREGEARTPRPESGS